MRKLKVVLRLIAVACVCAPLALTVAAQQKANNRGAASSVARPAADGGATPQTPARKPTATEADTTAGGTTTAATAVKAEQVTYAYEFTQPQFVVRRIRVEHDAAGRGTMTFERRDDAASLTESVEVAPGALARIRAAWDALNFLDSEESYQADKQFPHLGTTRLEMRRGVKSRSAAFNWTHHPQVETLVTEYRRLGDQQLFVFEIGLAREYQPTESVKLFKRLESILARDGVSDNVQLAAVLRDLATDERLPLIARRQAEQLLKKIEK
ncbi:MAG: hypothetical protein ACRD9R_16475 [Pyrinomonadaceae bacterium]